MSKKKKIGLGMIGIVILLVIGISLYAIKGRSEAEESTVQVERYTVPPREHVFVNGRIEPRNIESFGMDTSKGTVHKVHVVNGQTVESGAPIVTYKQAEVEGQIKEIQYQIQEAKALKNSQASVTSGVEAEIEVSSTAEYDSQIKRLESQLKDLEDREYFTEKASIGGKVYVEEFNSQEGIASEKITVQSDDYVVKGTVNEKDVLKLSEGMEAEITVVSNDKKLKGSLESINSRPSGALGQTEQMGLGVSTGGQSLSEYEVLIKLENIEGVKEGFHVQAKIVYGEDRIIIPSTALIEENGKNYVFLVQDEALKKKEVQIAPLENAGIDGTDNEFKLDTVVKKGLKQRDEIVVNPSKELKDGDRVGE